MDKVLLWDFDGVLMNSNETRDLGFNQVLRKFPKNQVAELIKYHQQNGGLSRYVKFRYFFEKIRQEDISDSQVQVYADKFSKIMLQYLVNNDLLIDETISFVQSNYQKIPMHIVSGSDQVELQYICKKIGIGKYFLSIKGSPTPKVQLVENIITKYHYSVNSCILIGDSFNDYEAAMDNKIHFSGYNNIEVEKLSTIEVKYK